MGMAEGGSRRLAWRIGGVRRRGGGVEFQVAGCWMTTFSGPWQRWMPGEMTGEMKYYIAAESIVESALEGLYDATGCGVLRYGEAAKDEVGWGSGDATECLCRTRLRRRDPVGRLCVRLEALNGRED